MMKKTIAVIAVMMALALLLTACAQNRNRSPSKALPAIGR